MLLIFLRVLQEEKRQSLLHVKELRWMYVYHSYLKFVWFISGGLSLATEEITEETIPFSDNFICILECHKSLLDLAQSVCID